MAWSSAGFFQEVRNRTFYSLHELNTTFRNYLKRLNHSIMKDYGVSRAQRFEHEQKLLRPLPASRFELREWRHPKVHPDCHIQVDKNFYSVPFVYVKQKVRVRVTEKLIEVFNQDDQPIAVHRRLRGTGLFSTFDAHYPEAKLSVARFEVHHAKEQAQRLGPQVEQLVNELLSGNYPLRHLRRVQGILRLGKSHPITPEALDHACQLALTFRKTRLAYVKACALYFIAHGHKPHGVSPQRPLDSVHLHGMTEEGTP